ncbi:MAG: site-2 protease family protein [bacterium]|nr:site-2 protease family protein [bacterium]
MFATIFIFIALIAVLIMVHEAGHFFTAKKAGIKVEEFGFGFPPRIFGIQRGETLYSLNLIPLGGFVKIFGEEGEYTEDSRSFSNRTAGVRSLIISAGVLMNMALAMVLFSAGHMIGLPTILEDGASEKNFTRVQIQVIEIASESPAMTSGLAIGDVIVSIDGKRFDAIDGLRGYVDARRGKEISIEVLHDGVSKILAASPRENPPEGEGPLGFAMVKTAIEKLSWHQAIGRGIKDSFVLAWLFLKALGDLFLGLFTTGKISGDVTGPVGIAVLTGRVVKLGIAHLLQFAGVISVNLALINIFPIPALDGGRLLFILLEKLKGRPIPRLVEQKIHQVSFVVLLTLMLLVTVRDVVRLF